MKFTIFLYTCRMEKPTLSGSKFYLCHDDCPIQWVNRPNILVRSMRVTYFTVSQGRFCGPYTYMAINATWVWRTGTVFMRRSKNDIREFTLSHCTEHFTRLNTIIPMNAIIAEVKYSDKIIQPNWIFKAMCQMPDKNILYLWWIGTIWNELFIFYIAI